MPKELNIKIVKASNKIIKAPNNKSVILIEDPLILEFCNKQSPKSKQTYKTIFRKLLEFDPKITGQDMLAQKEHWERVRIFEFRNWIIEKKGLSENFAVASTGCVRGFFSHNRMTLNFNKSESRSLTRASNKTKRFFFGRTDIAKMWSLANLEEKWVLSNKSFGMRAEDFQQITWSNLRTLKLDDEPPVSFGEFPSTKEGTTYHSFVDSDVVKVIAEMLEVNKDKKDSDKVYTKSDDQLSYTIQKLTEKAGIVTGTEKVSFHAMRRFLFNILTNYMSEIKADMILGHSTGSNVNSAYVSSDDLRECYARAMGDLLVNGNGAIKAVKAKVEALSTTTEQLVKMLSEKDAQIKSQKEEMEEFKKKTLKEIFDIKGMLGQRSGMNKEEVIEIFKTLLKTARNEEVKNRD